MVECFKLEDQIRKCYEPYLKQASILLSTRTGVNQSWMSACLDDSVFVVVSIIFSKMVVFSHKLKMYISLHAPQKVPDYNEFQRSLQNCGSSIWNCFMSPFWYLEF